tara:strand:+ start:216 stop:425 length:210 start_codon:yes stop_codon:yes gene_type:complete
VRLRKSEPEGARCAHELKSDLSGGERGRGAEGQKGRRDGAISRGHVYSKCKCKDARTAGVSLFGNFGNF